MKSKNNILPDFDNEEQEREFWLKNSPLDYFDTSNPKKEAFLNLKPSARSISLRLPVDMIATLKILAHKKAIPYQSLAKMFIATEIKKENILTNKKNN